MEATVVVTIFSKTQVPPTTWAEHITALVPHIEASLALNPSSPMQRFLDGTSSSGHRVLELRFPSPSTKTQSECTSAAHALSAQAVPLGLSLVLQPLSSLHKLSPSKAKRLAVFDMDSTLIQQEVIDELAREVGVYSAVAAITEAAMRGDAQYADFTASLRARVALLKGVDGGVWDRLKSKVVSFTPGARELVKCLKRDGWSAAVLSGGFVPLAEWVQAELGLDYARANRLETDFEGRLTGRLQEGAEIVDGERKRALLGEIARQEGVQGVATLAVGDGSNDLLMMGEAALGVAFNAKPRVQERAPAVVNSESLVDVLYVLGWTEAEIQAVVGETEKSH
ncbi:hypothetical protein ANO11243_051920 [Dothideomycetidae sp. 11243]|nr:hypothetical protein ANO11243_051920 [fungal sp. No.11243]